jgi:uncharacterized membrane protein
MDEHVPVAAVLVGAAVMIGSALLLHVLGKRAADGRLRRNGLIGIRLPSTLSSDTAWRAGHRAAQRSTDIGAAGMGLAGVLAVLFQGSKAGFVASVFLGAGWLLVWVLIGAKKAAAAAEAASSREAL